MVSERVEFRVVQGCFCWFLLDSIFCILPLPKEYEIFLELENLFLITSNIDFEQDFKTSLKWNPNHFEIHRTLFDSWKIFADSKKKEQIKVCFSLILVQWARKLSTLSPSFSLNSRSICSFQIPWSLRFMNCSFFSLEVCEKSKITFFSKVLPQ